MPTKRTKKIEQVKAKFESQGHKADRYGNYPFEQGDKKYRYKLNAQKMRLEYLMIFSNGEKEWRLLKSWFYKDIEV